MKNEKKHPTVEEEDVIYANATTFRRNDRDRQKRVSWEMLGLQIDSAKMVLNTTTTKLKLKRSNNMKPQNILNLIENTPLVNL
jgi:hypothetical protein